MFEFVDKVDHVLAHRRAVDPVNTPSSLQAGVFCLQHTHTDKNTKWWKWEAECQWFERRMQNQCTVLPLLSRQPACQTSRLWLTQWWSCSPGCCTGCWHRRKNQGRPACRCCSGPPAEGEHFVRLVMIIHTWIHLKFPYSTWIVRLQENVDVFQWCFFCAMPNFLTLNVQGQHNVCRDSSLT